MKFRMAWFPVGVSAGLVLTSVALAAPVQAAVSHAQDTVHVSSGFLLSAKPKTVVLNPRTGAVISVRSGPAVSAHSGTAVPMITIHYTCNASWACYQSASVPYPNIGFSGSAGIKRGTWTFRSQFDTNNYTAKACWTYQGSSHCSPKSGPSTVINFNGETVTGTSARLY